jgi:hypothetical protein
VSQKAILEALLTHLSTMSNGIPIAWPGVNFTPPDSGFWLQPRHFPNETVNIAWGNDSKNEYLGFLQVGVYGRPGQGIVGMSDLAEDVIAHFPKGLELAGVRVRKRPHQSPPVDDDDKMFIPVTIHYLGIL